jgi:penicillin-binding protein 2
MHRPRLPLALSLLLVLACSEPAPAPAPASAATPDTPPAPEPAPAPEPPNWSARAQQALDEAGVPGTVVVLDLRHGSLATAERAGRSKAPATTPRSPGSTVKPLLALAALHEHLVAPTESITCDGTREIDGKPFTCFASHGPLTLSGALATSCNGYAFELATRLGLSRVHRHYQAFGLADEGGVVPDQPDTLANVASVGTGHAGLLVSPVALARAYAALATSTAPAGHTETWAYSPEELQTVRTAMAGAVESPDGTAHAVAIPGLRIVGKTGTTDDGDGREPYRLGLFAGWAGHDQPELVVVVQLETDKTGREAAVPVARRVFEGLLAPK